MSQEVIKIKGGNKLNGKVQISGAKNSAVALIPASLMANDVVTLDGLPDISDVKTLMSLLGDLNIKTDLDGDQLVVDSSDAVNLPLPNNKVQSLRASYYMMGAMLGRFKKCVIGLPGGCPLGPRPIDQHIKGFEALGAKVTNEQGAMYLIAEELVGAKIFMDVVSVGATINIMLAASLAKGKTVIENAAKEPEIVDVATLLNNMGAKIRGAGTDTLKIEGVESLHGTKHAIIPDRIEAGTYMCAAAAMGEEVYIENIIPLHLEPLIAKLKEMGTEIELGEDSILIKGKDEYKPVDIQTSVYPGFATDLQQPFTPLLLKANGQSKITETIYPARFKHVDELIRMGAKVSLENGTAIYYPSKLTGASVAASDLRAGASLLIAGLISDGVTTVYNVNHIHRGYSGIVDKLKALGADIWTETV
ncbi:MULTISPECIES: UDP-N-acetylglucosamine 1-carboxyvinyltransferase [Mammaliicoccus]|uniref:UDP-N-acetylglucosamine 1-carboxyvinyltransferase n=1 Tax=Mammaliicoccus fleurettii TaxID=150056 RepID=A0ABS5MNG5_9STAP|nr:MULTISPECIES: UDP-N-acetylglucosamine 1-carboxyvinyltransferase [Mammaliicoccus]MBL0846762.1 UDP-N-acetylglucosamine 1-carboxyvinyltransferase [Mammaliicoccus fleurettii]MBS3672318.1 UDP-N-acetylglucosamine 1-carboxyvinyltransferase [Mammaliicoccus fleurettii]MBS3697224.1 UDP-N-acetylglucosamine 1-carboxyvinyltransferase [Mammaliicoccus fleurettii]MBW0765284.1 UDP-N-acetylglucosamine 1-carboxyvinyltransferase [Mammaliicoccus fleurettii]MDT3995285.1 UDP-N-acetylglucosamine 1-carboxyvinyltran